MIPKKVVSYVLSLQQKKYRQRHQAFVVEGAKSVVELLQSDLEVEHLFATADFLDNHTKTIPKSCPVETVTEEELANLGTFETNNAAIAIAKMRTGKLPPQRPGQLTLALDDVRDPGNLGTIVRIADWYGIRHLVCSETTADFYNPKVISASMGSFTRVEASYLNLADYLRNQVEVPIYGALMDGKNVYEADLKARGILVMGNESNGISKEVQQYIQIPLTIPRFGKAESLNVAIATAILCDHFMRPA